MPAYSYRVISDIQYNAKSLGEMFFNKTKLMLSPDEFIAAFIDPEHVGKLREVQELVGFVGQNNLHTTLASSHGGRYATYLTFGGSAPVIIPQYAAKGIQPTCPPDVRQKILSWIDERVRFGEAFGDAIDAVSMLNDECGDAAAMRVMLPCLPTIMASVHASEEDRTVKRAKKVAASKRFGYLPRLPQAVKQRLLEISAVVNSVMLAKDAPEPALQAQHATVQVLNMARGEPGRPSPLYTGDITRVASFV